jgi:hypothetical protein
LLSGLICFVTLYLLCGCASFKDTAGRSGQESIQQTGTTASVPMSGTDGSESLCKTNNACASPAPTNESKIAGTVQVCRLESAQCFLQTTDSPASIPSPGTTGPVVQVPEATYDFGSMPGYSVFSHKFVIKNVGTSELVIKKIFPG